MIQLLFSLLLGRQQRLWKLMTVGISSLLICVLLFSPVPVRGQNQTNVDHQICLAGIGGGLRQTPSKFMRVATVANPQPKPATESIVRWTLYHVFYEGSEYPSWQTLVGDNAAGECKNFMTRQVGYLPFSYFMGTQQGDILALAKWQSLRQLPGGEQRIQQMLNATQVEPGETHAVTLTAEDAKALKQIGYRLSPKVQVLAPNWLPQPSK
jgi:hypothetical protein